MAVDLKTHEDPASAISQSVLEHVRRVVAPELVSDLTLDRSLDDLGLDSITRLSMLNCLEEAFHIRFTEDSLYDMVTCRDVIDYIEATVNGRGVNPRPGRQAAAPSASPVPATGPVPSQHYDVSQFPECVALEQRFAGTASVGLENPFFRVKQRVRGATATIADREVVSYTSFDYLGMASDPAVKAAAQQAIDQFGTSGSASRLVGGNHALVAQLDEKIARFLGTEAAAVFPSGYGTNASVLGHLFGPDDLILYDELAHNSIVQGTLASKAQRRPFPHNDAGFVDKLLDDVRGSHRRVVVAIEGLYSMDGDYPDLPQFLEVKRRHAALLYVDEAHSVGVLGATGRGLCEHYGVDPADGDLWMGTISKALGSLGGYLAGRRMLVQYLKYTTPAFVFATALPPANAAAALAALHLLQVEPDRVARLRDRAQLFLKLADDCGLDTGKNQDSPVVPIIVGDSMRCIRLASALLLRGIDVQPILYPAVPESQSRLRFFITAEHSEEQISATVQALAECLGTPQA